MKKTQITSVQLRTISLKCQQCLSAQPPTALLFNVGESKDFCIFLDTTTTELNIVDIYKIWWESEDTKGKIEFYDLKKQQKEQRPTPLKVQYTAVDCILGEGLREI